MEDLSIKLDFIDTVPEAILTIDPRDLYTLLPNPTMIHIKGKGHRAPIFISTLLHGNETTGFYALQRLLKKYVFGNVPCPRDMIILIGNVQAARYYQRRLEDQVDFNRIWAGSGLAKHGFAQQVIHYLQDKQPFACIDIHNNTGENPFYGCVNNLKPQSLHLAKRYSNKVVYFLRPVEAMSVALNQFFTAITLETGHSGDIAGIERVVGFIEEVLQLDALETNTLTNTEVQVYHSIAKINVPEEASMTFHNQSHLQYDFTFIENLETLNFSELPENSRLGWRNNNNFKLTVINEQGEDISDEIFTYHNNEIRIKRSIIPSMFCLTEKVIRQDCLGYIMQRYSID